MSENLNSQEIMAYVTELASAYLSTNEVSPDDLPEVIKKIFSSVVGIMTETDNMKNRPVLTPAVPVEESIHDDYIVCLEDGKKLQMLKRHLSTVYNMTVDEYRERWRLPADYPVVSPNYAKRRSEIAKTTGLGSTGRKKLRVA